MSVSAKQMPAEEVTGPMDDARVEKVSRAMPSPTKTPSGAPSSVWEQWLVSQRAKVDGTARMADQNSVKRRVAELRKNRPNTARSDGHFDSRLATASGFTNTGKEATVVREHTMAMAAIKEQKEVEELKELLARTSYTGGGNSYKRAGNVATASLMKLNDGQADSIAVQRARRVAEEAAASVMTGRPAWDSTAHKDTPPALKGCVPVTPEPWARDASVYEEGMKGHGFKAYKHAPANEDGVKKHVSIIQNEMMAYRRELGSEKKAPVSARHLRAWGESVPATPKTPHTGRTTGRTTGRSARKGNPTEPAMSPAAVARAERIKSKSPASPSPTGDSGGKK